jgi:CheY-like chemotaxis protein
MQTLYDTNRILIVDDSQEVRESLGWLLRDESGLTVAGEAVNGAEAIRLAMRLEPDMVILDIELPDLDGYSVTKQLKALPHPPQVVLLSIHSDAISKQRGALAGCDAFVEKGTSWPKVLRVPRETLKPAK